MLQLLKRAVNCRSLVYRTRGKRRDQGFEDTYIGQCLPESDLARLTLKVPFEGALLANSDHQEAMLDHVFSNLGLDTPSVEHPILMTEPICNPALCRHRKPNMNRFND